MLHYWVITNAKGGMSRSEATVIINAIFCFCVLTPQVSTNPKTTVSRIIKSIVGGLKNKLLVTGFSSSLMG